MTAPKTKRHDPGFSQLGVWIRSSLMRELRAAADAGKSQREIVEDALEEYFERQREESAKTAPP